MYSSKLKCLLLLTKIPKVTKKEHKMLNKYKSCCQKVDRQAEKSHFRASDLITAVSIARSASEEAFDDDGGKTHRGGKRQRGQHETGGAVARCSATNSLKCVTNHQIKRESKSKEGHEFI